MQESFAIVGGLFWLAAYFNSRASGTAVACYLSITRVDADAINAIAEKVG
jgi:hypothetical protein